MAARDSRKREMIAKLKDDAYVSTLVDEAYTIIMSTLELGAAICQNEV